MLNMNEITITLEFLVSNQFETAWSIKITALGQFAVGQFAVGTVRRTKKKKILTEPNLT